MPDTNVAVQIASSGSPVSFETAPNPSVGWPSASKLLSAFLGNSFGITLTRQRESVFLTRAHQRAMDRALRRSVRIIA